MCALPRVYNPRAATDLIDLQMYLNTVTQSRINLNIKVKFGSKLWQIMYTCECLCGSSCKPHGEFYSALVYCKTFLLICNFAFVQDQIQDLISFLT